MRFAITAQLASSRIAAVAAVWAGCSLLAGCGTAGRDYLNENDRLRSENLTLNRTVQKLQKTLDLRLKQIEVLEQQLGGATKVVGVEPSDIPRLVALEMGRLSGVIDTNSDGVNDTIRVYVRTVDQYGHFMRVMGPADIQVVSIDPGRDPVVLVDESLTAQQFEQAYRSGVTGTHYTLTVSLPASQGGEVKELIVKVVLTDAGSGVKISCQRVLSMGQTGRPGDMPDPSL